MTIQLRPCDIFQLKAIANTDVTLHAESHAGDLSDLQVLFYYRHDALCAETAPTQSWSHESDANRIKTQL